MGDVIDIATKIRYMGDDGIDPHDEIDLTITIATALVLISPY